MQQKIVGGHHNPQELLDEMNRVNPDRPVAYAKPVEEVVVAKDTEHSVIYAKKSRRLLIGMVPLEEIDLTRYYSVSYLRRLLLDNGYLI